jgi:hypothetical protein
MVNPKLMEAWFNLMAEAMKGSHETKNMFQSLSEMSGKTEEMGQWARKFMPMALNFSGKPDVFEDWLEESWQIMGVVPRARYLDLLEKNDNLQRKLEKAEATIERLKNKLNEGKKSGDDSTETVEFWNSMVEDALRAQTEWMRSWTSASESVESMPQTEVDASPDELGKDVEK